MRWCKGVQPGGDAGKRHGPVATTRDDEQPRTVQEELVFRAGSELERVEQTRLRIADVDGVQLPVRDGEEGVPVRLHQVGLVDALLLDVRAREVDALLRRGCACRLGDPVTADHRAAEPVRADETGRVQLCVAKQLAAGAKRDESRGIRVRAGHRSAQRQGRESGQRREESNVLISYVTVTGERHTGRARTGQPPSANYTGNSSSARKTAAAHHFREDGMNGMTPQSLAKLVGIVFLLVGVLGFVPGITTNYGDMSFAGHNSGAELLGIFQVSILHNIVHLLFGVAGLALAKTADGARTFFIGGGVIYLVLWLYGIVIDKDGGANFVPVDAADNWLHLGLGVGMITLGVITSRGPRTSVA